MSVRTLPIDVFARLAPETLMQRYLEQGARPAGRSLTERRPVVVAAGSQDLAGCVGSAVARAGNATVLCGITGALTSLEDQGGVYVNVEIRRGGRTGNPTLEEQCLTMSAHRLIQTANISPENFVISADCPYRLVLNASVQVLSRTGPCLDLVWEAVVAALKDTRIPEFAEDEKTREWAPVYGQTHDQARPLDLPENLPVHYRTVGVYAAELLADIDGPIEEQCVQDRICAARTADSELTAFSLAVSTPVSLDTVLEALKLTR